MKITLFIFALLMASCTSEDKPTICDCNAITTVNNVPNGETYPYSEDCADNGKLLFEFFEPGYVSRRIVRCD
jgi:hypothetical protein